MKHSIKQQIAAVNLARKLFGAHRKKAIAFSGVNLPIIEKAIPKLNDAASTLSALNLIGQDKVLIASELITEAQKLIALYNESSYEGMIPKQISKLAAIIKRLPK